MTFSYDKKPESKDILVTYLLDGAESFYEGIETDFESVGNRYGFQCLCANAIERSDYQHCLIKHIIILVKSDDVLKTMRQYEPLLSWYGCMSIGFVYSHSKVMREQGKVVEELKKKYGDHVNFLRPDKLLSENCYVSRLKILDNAVCDTIRIKYIPKQISQDIPNMSETYKHFFNEASRLYTDHKLYHRSPSDGFFAARYENGIYVTATKTYKNPLDLTRIAYVHDYDEETNVLTYSGPYLPSSDIVEAFIVMKNNPDISCIVHTHASELFTRNEDYRHKIQVGRGSYGVPEIGYQINQVIRANLNDFIIIEEHGEFFTYTHEPVEAIKKLSDFLIEVSCSEDAVV